MDEQHHAMTDAEAAEHYFVHQNDPDLFGELVEVRTRDRLPRVVSVRFDPHEAEEIDRRAEDAGLPVPAYVRQAALNAERVSAEKVLHELVALRDAVSRIEDKLGA
ncbi:plasmid mobilization protein [Streptoalloteichus hindustanus]|uniref:plasmid mobilization protein n=1 Tax=Streptoalloteichus hindustanus TaxID=2017 RepID=UPI0011614756|nr:hypothetical protein [Streptoalloteichus hindustanus]